MSVMSSVSDERVQPADEAAQTPRIIIGFLLLAGLICVVAIGVIEAKHLATRNTDVAAAPHRKNINQLTVAIGTNVENPALHYGIVVDCGSSGSRVYVYFWPPHSGNPQELLNVQQMRDDKGELVVKKIEPGISSYANNPSGASTYIKPLLDYGAQHIPEDKHKETPLYIMATAGLRLLPESQQNAIIDDLRKDIPLEYNFLFTENHAEVISGKQEGVYAWISINFMLGKFEHMVGEDPLSIVDIPGTQEQTHIRKRTTGVIDMGGGSVQIAFEVPQSVSFEPQEEVAKSLLAEFNLGCRGSDVDHKYRIYVATFLGFGGNEAWKRYEKSLLASATKNVKPTSVQQDNTGAKKTNGTDVAAKNVDNVLMPDPTLMENSDVGYPGISEGNPILDPCLPLEMKNTISYNGQKFHVRGLGDYLECQSRLKNLLNNTQPCMKQPCSMNGVYQPEIDSRNSEFYGFSEFFYTMEDVLRMGGTYEYLKFQKAASEYCSTKWDTLHSWYEGKLYPKADENRFRLQCFKSAWITTVLHDGFKIPKVYKFFTSAMLVNGRQVHWSLGALLYKIRYYPLSEIQHHESHNYRPPWDVSHYPHSYNILILCFVIVFMAILVYLRRLRVVRSAHLRKVPTMAYFMTEQDQLEDGVLVTDIGKTFYS